MMNTETLCTPDFIRQDLFQYMETAADEIGLLKSVKLPQPAADLITSNPNAFLFGLIADQSVKAETAWILPYQLLQRLGHLDVQQIADMNPEAFEALFKQKPALHRFPGPTAANIRNACHILLRQYDGNAENIWKEQPAGEIVERLKYFAGIGDKKAALGAMILYRDFGVQFSDTDKINIACDVHLLRIFSRTGLSKSDPDAVMQAARQLHPVYPGLLTTPFWLIGRKFCHATSPDCDSCVIKRGCARNI